MNEPSYLHDTRASYNTVAESYAGMVRATEPWEGSMLAAFTELVLRSAAEREPAGFLMPGVGRVG